MMKIRPSTPDDFAGIAEVHVKAWQETYKGIVSDEYLAGLSVAKRSEVWKAVLTNPKPGYANFVAFNEKGEIVGFADGGATRDLSLPFSGELYAIYLMQLYQGQGIGRRLLRCVAQHLQQLNFDSLVIWVLKENPTLNFYLRFGGKIASAKQIEIGGKKYEELAIGWQNLQSSVIWRDERLQPSERTL